ncbi:RHS repeat-associated core domain-containing protein [Prevotella histicola]
MLYWEEENRLMVLKDNNGINRYTYNAAGERIMKSYGTMEGVYINGAPQGITFHETDNFTLYPASILSVNKNRFTKHYFIGDTRVASRIGTGMFNNVYGRNGSYVTAGQQDYAERMNQIQTQKEAYYKKVGVAPGVPTEKGAYGDPENTGVGYNAVLTELGNHDVPQGWIQTPHPNTTPGTNPGPPVSWNDPSNPDDPQAGYGYIPNDTTKEETFFYHSDHLGSTSYITDDRANITQYDAYLPYGELLVDEHSSSEELPYKFNGKEMDEETGLYYYGARYMDPMASIWYGVDPLAEKYANNSSYTYCLDNPIRWIDRKGMKWEDPKEAEKLKNQINTKIESIKKDISNYQKKLMQEGLSTRKVEKINEQINEAESRISNLDKSKSDIDLLGQDENNTYVLTRIDGGRHTVRQGNNEKVYIETSSDALSIHEITHVRQSLTSGGLRFGRGGELLNAGKSLAAIANMEIEAYRMQYSFDTTFPGNTYGKGLKGIDLQSVGNIMDDQHQIVYPIIYDYAVSVREANKKSLKISKSKMR